MIATLGMVGTSIGPLLGLEEKKNEEDDEKTGDDKDKKKSKNGVKTVESHSAAGSVAILLLTENLAGKMALMDKWTILMTGILGVQAVLAITSKEKKDEDEEEQA